MHADTLPHSHTHTVVPDGRNTSPVHSIVTLILDSVEHFPCLSRHSDLCLNWFLGGGGEAQLSLFWVELSCPPLCTGLTEVSNWKRHHYAKLCHASRIHSQDPLTLWSPSLRLLSRSSAGTQNAIAAPKSPRPSSSNPANPTFQYSSQLVLFSLFLPSPWSSSQSANI